MAAKQINSPINVRRARPFLNVAPKPSCIAFTARSFASAAAARVDHKMRSVLVGAPGSGKGTHAASMIKRWPSLQSIVSGNLLRQEMAEETPLGLEAAQVMKEGGLLPDEIMVDLLQPHIQEAEDDLLFDGFPRTVGQARLLDDLLQKLGKPLNLVIHLDVPEELILERIEGRWYHPPSGRVYNDTFNPPKKKGLDDVTDEPLEKRIDDTRAVFGARIDRYNKEAQPMLQYYREQDQRLNQRRLVTVSGPTSKVIWPQIEALISERFPELGRISPAGAVPKRNPTLNMESSGKLDTPAPNRGKA